jgi:hypothetical protein
VSVPERRPARPKRRRAGRARDRGSASVEIVFITPLLVAVLGCAFLAGRLVLARQSVEDAAHTALQAAVTMPDGPAARSLAAGTARLVLAASHGLCSSVSIVTDTAHFTAGGTVLVRVSCVVRLAHLAVLGIPGSVSISAVGQAVIEPYRAVGP